MLAGKQWVMGAQHTTCDPYAMVDACGDADQGAQELHRVEDRMLERPAVRKILEREENPLLKAA